MSIVTFASEFAAELRKVEDDHNGEEMNHWLQVQGYDTTLATVEDAQKELQQTSLLMRSGMYNTTITAVVIKIQCTYKEMLHQPWVRLGMAN